MPHRLALTNSNLFPVQAFFNAIGDSSFVRVVEHLTRGVGYTINDADCAFPEDLDPGEETFEGVRFSLYEDSTVISSAQLREYLETVCHQYVDSHPEDKAVLTELLSRTVL